MIDIMDDDLFEDSYFRSILKNKRQKSEYERGVKEIVRTRWRRQWQEIENWKEERELNEKTHRYLCFAKERSRRNGRWDEMRREDKRLSSWRGENCKLQAAKTDGGVYGSDFNTIGVFMGRVDRSRTDTVPEYRGPSLLV